MTASAVTHVDLARWHKHETFALVSRKVLAGFLFIPLITAAFKPETFVASRLAIAVAVIAVAAIAVSKRVAGSLAYIAPHLASNEVLDLELYFVVPVVAMGIAILVNVPATLVAERELRRLAQPPDLYRVAYQKPAKRQYRMTREVFVHGALGFVLLLVAGSPWYAFDWYRQLPRTVSHAVWLLALTASGHQFYKYLGARTRAAVDDGRPPILVLRSFASDPALKEEQGRDAGVSQDDYRSLADHVVSPFYEYGRIVTVASKGEGLPGAYFGDLETPDDWQTVIKRTAGAASLIVIFVEQSQSLAWEIELIASDRDLRRKTLFVWTADYGGEKTAELLETILRPAYADGPRPVVTPAKLRALRFGTDDRLLAVNGPIASGVFEQVAMRFVLAPR